MDAERARVFLLGLQHVAETMQWGDNLVFWVGDKAIGGKMFALISLDAGFGATADGRKGFVISFPTAAERRAELVEVEGLRPAPYFARIGWLAAEHWEVLPFPEWKTALAAAHAVVLAKLPKRTREVLAMPARAQKALIAERRREKKDREKA